MTIRQIATVIMVAGWLAAPAFAETQTVGSLTIADGWARATPPNAPTAGGYLTIINGGTESDRLVAVASPVAETVQIHVMEVKDGVMSMHALGAPLEIPPGDTATLVPGGLHLMLTGLKQSLTEGDEVPVTLTFETAGRVDTILAVQPIGAKGPPAMQGQAQ